MANQKLTALTEESTLENADLVYVVTDVATTPISKKTTWTTIKAFLKTYFDTLYSPSTPRIVSAASYTTDTGTSLSWDTTDQFEVTAQAGALKFNNPSGTPSSGLKIIIRVKDNGTARALTYDTQYRAIGVTLPTTTVIGKTTYLGGIWNSADNKLDIVAVSQEV